MNSCKKVWLKRAAPLIVCLALAACQTTPSAPAALAANAALNQQHSANTNYSGHP